MSSPTLESLPIEILLSIAEYVESTHKPTLYDIRLVSRQLHSIAVRILSRTVRFYIRGLNEFTSDVRKCTTLLQHTSRSEYVQRLVIQGVSSREDDGKVDAIEPRPRGFGFDSSLYDDDIMPSNPDDSARDHPPSGSNEEEATWEPMIQLLQHLTKLSDFVYADPGRFPPSVLQALHRHRPNCRLHIGRWDLRSLDQPALDPDEWALATSPCLYSVVLQYLWRYFLPPCDWRYTDGSEDYNEEALLQLVAGRAPNLKAARIHRFTREWSLENHIAQQVARRPWRGFALDIGKQYAGRGSLRQLHFAGDTSIALTKQDIENWDMHTNFAELRDLILESAVQPDALQYLTEECSFPSLRKLVMKFAPNGPRAADAQTLWMPWRDFYDLVVRFLESLPGLVSLKVLDVACTQRMFYTVIQQHGASLRELDFRELELPQVSGLASFTTDQRHVQYLVERCPLIKTLSMTMARSGGDRSERAIYKELGAIPRLAELCLTLDAGDYSPDSAEAANDLSFSTFQAQRDAFINRAVDEKLACAIFYAIADSKPDDALPLNKVVIKMTGGRNLDDFGSLDVGLEQVLNNLGRSWLLERNPRDDRQGEVVVTELGRNEREKAESANTMHKLPWNIEPAFRACWPETEPGSDWRSDWRSHPLETI